jgi:hypothetical protein
MKKDLIGTYDFVQTLYRQGNTNNEQLAQLLTMLKEISEARPTEISEDFKSLFKDLDLSDDTLNNTGVMLMMFLTKLAVSYKPTYSSEFTQNLWEVHYGNVLLVQQISELSQAGLNKLNVELIDGDKANEKIIELMQHYTTTLHSIRDTLTNNYLDTQQKLNERLKKSDC